MKKKTTKSIKSILLSIMLFISIALSAQNSVKQNFILAKNEIESMLSGKTPLDYEKAVFITENAYYGGYYSYDNFKNEITFAQNFIEDISNRLLLYNTIQNKKNILVSKDSAKANYLSLARNYAIFNYITDTTFANINKTVLFHYPFKYSYQDPFASENWENSHTINLLNSQTNSGNCYALTVLYKIFSLRLNINANLCTTQGHIFITHSDENGRTYNVELASKAFPGSGSIETITHTSDESVRKGISMRELDLKQSVGLCLINLAKGYQHKLNLKADDFMLQCAELVLKYDSLNLNAILLKASVLEERVINLNKPFEQSKNTKEFLMYQNYIKSLYQLGYREMPIDMKNHIIAAITKDTNYVTLFKDNTYYPFAGINKKHHRSASLSNGLFEEVDIDKPHEKYFRTIFDTKAKKIISFTTDDIIYSRYKFDPIVFAWQIDPLAHKQPYLSPYNAFNNNPIYYVDPDGRSVVPADDKSKAAIETRIQTTFSGELAQYAQNLQYTTIGSYKDAGGNDVIIQGFKFIPSQGVADVNALLFKIKQSNMSKEAKALASAYAAAIGSMDAVVISSVENGARPFAIGTPVINNDGTKASKDYADNPSADNLEKLTGASNENGDGVLYYPSKDGAPKQIDDGSGQTLKGKIVGAYTTNKATPAIVDEVIGDFNAKSNNTPKIRSSNGDKTYLGSEGKVVTDPATPR